jgi:predicted nuclease of predicted toxin-antitoxin system
LRGQGHDFVEARTLGADSGDLALLEFAAGDDRVLVTLDSDFGKLVYVEGIAHAGLVRLPDVRSDDRVRLMCAVLENHSKELQRRAVVTVRGERIRISLGGVGPE